MSAMEKHNVVWQPQPGPQTLLLKCHVREIFYGGARGGGKTDGFLGHWLDHAESYGEHAKGIFFRPSYPELEAAIDRAKQIYLPLGAQYQDYKKTFTFPRGAKLKMRYLEKDSDADNYQGHDYSWMGFEELTNWKSPEPLDKVRGALRSAAGIPCWYLANANPGGPGHSWVKQRYIDPSPPMVPFMAPLLDGGQVQRIFIPAFLDDNMYLRNDEAYKNSLRAAGPAWLVQAWLKGDWNIAPGSFLEGVWDPARHIIKPFDIPMNWKRWRAMDWGYRRPYSIGWYAMDFDGVIHRYRELYGYGGAPNKGTEEDGNKVAKRIQDIERLEREAGIRFMNNPADSSIWSRQGVERCVADMFRQQFNPELTESIKWTPADKSSGSRVNGAQEIVAMLNADKFVVHSTCKHWLRTVPVISPDPKKLEDVDTDQEDHAWDETRYSVVSRRTKPKEVTDNRPKPGSMAHLLMGGEDGDEAW